MRLQTPVSVKLFLQDHPIPVWYRNLKIRPLTQDPWNDPAFIWPDQVAAIAVRPLPGSDRGRTGAPGGIEAAWLRLTPGDPGRILVDLSPATAWELGLRDAGGHRLAVFKGVGPGSRVLSASVLAPGTYFLTGNAGGRPLVKPLRVAPSP